MGASVTGRPGSEVIARWLSRNCGAGNKQKQIKTLMQSTTLQVPSACAAARDCAPT